MICPSCQTELPDEIAKCTVCGHDFSSEDITNQASASSHRPVKPLGDMPKTKISHEESSPPATKVASSWEEDIGITKIHGEVSIPPTRVAKIEHMEQTLIPEQVAEPKPIYGWLVILEGKHQWTLLTVFQEERRYIIGNAPECDIYLEEQAAELHHASLRFKGKKLYLTDLDTANGTQVQGEEISRTELQDGDEIKIGSAVVRFRKL